MKEKTTININTKFMALIIAIFLLFTFSGCSFTGAWFTDNNSFDSIDEVAQIEMRLLNGSNELMTLAPSFVYNGPATNTLVVKAATTINTSINAITRVMIMASWSNDLAVYSTALGNTISYNFNNEGWSQVMVGDIGFNYVYYNTILAPNTSAIFLNSITFPTLPAEYIGATLTLTIAVSGLQANTAGVALWAPEAPVGWNPLAV